MEIKYNGKNIQAVVFDLDGTLYRIGFLTKVFFIIHNFRHVSLFSAHRKVMKDLRKKDYGCSEKYFDKLFTNISRITGRDKINIKIWYFTDFRKDFITTLAKNCRKNIAVEKIAAMVKKLNFKTALLSDFGFIEERLDALNIDKHLFDILVSGEEEGALKPQTRPLLKISNQLGVLPENTVLIGDRNDTDGCVAESTGMTFINVQNIGAFEKFLKIDISGVV